MPKAIFESDRCKVYLWEGVTPDAPGEPLDCDTFTPRALQVEGDFTRAYLDAAEFLGAGEHFLFMRQRNDDDAIRIAAHEGAGLNPDLADGDGHADVLDPEVTTAAAHGATTAVDGVGLR